MDARMRRTGTADDAAAIDGSRGERHWVDAYAEHVRKRFNSRVLISVRIAGEAPVELSYVYALDGGGLVLCMPSEHAEHHGESHEEAAEHAHGGGERGTGGSELWIASPGQAVFETRSVEDGVLCTGFGYLGASRTPHIIVPRGTEPPPKRDHHEHGDF